jgi:hypothetical protein
MRQGHPEADRLLERVVADVRQQAAEPQPHRPGPAPGGSQPGLAKTRGYGGFLNDCCQECGHYLSGFCYSERETLVRVPRTDKICKHCYAKLPLTEQNRYQKYIYKHGYEARGTGWNPRKPR